MSCNVYWIISCEEIVTGTYEFLIHWLFNHLFYKLLFNLVSIEEVSDSANMFRNEKKIIKIDKIDGHVL